MGLLDDLTPPKRVWGCKVRDVAAELDKKDAEVLLAAAMDPVWKFKTLETELAKRNIHIGQAQIKAHRTKVCSCWKI